MTDRLESGSSESYLIGFQSNPKTKGQVSIFARQLRTIITSDPVQHSQEPEYLSWPLAHTNWA